MELTEDQRIVRRRRRLVSYTAVVVLLILAGGGVWAYFSYKTYRAPLLIHESSILMAPGHYQEALDRLNEALRVDPTRRDIFAQRGFAYQNLGKPDLALEDYERALLIDSHQPSVLVARGMIYRGRGELPRAIAEFTKSLEMRENPDTYYERAQTYTLMEENRKAIADLDKVVEALRDAPHVLRARALLKEKLGDQAGFQADLAAAQEFERRAVRGEGGGKK